MDETRRSGFCQRLEVVPDAGAGVLDETDACISRDLHGFVGIDGGAGRQLHDLMERDPATLTGGSYEGMVFTIFVVGLAVVRAGW